jgi:hypothetical protein
VCTLHKQLRLKRLLLQHLRVRHHRFKLQLPLVRVKLLKDKLQFKRLKVKQPQLSDLRVEQTMAQTHQTSQQASQVKPTGRLDLNLIWR